MKKTVSRSKWLALTAVLSAMASVLYFLEMPVPLMPGFIQFDFSMLPIFIGNITLGPLSGIVITIIKDLIHLIIKGAGATGGVGDLADFFTCLCFILPSGLIYKRFPNFKGMIIGLVAGCFSSAILSGLLFNALVVYPLYDKFILPMTAIVAMYQQIRPSANGLWEVLAIFNMPYTFLKCVVISIIAVLIAKPLSSLLKIGKNDKNAPNEYETNTSKSN
ncbi:MAG: ECF transporter S component [Clostridia bacterium]|nr:ECF transporter S component [Clostridia bacterium]MDE6471677.1 ECF transporter S component [Clostridia bacterium]